MTKKASSPSTSIPLRHNPDCSRCHLSDKSPLVCFPLSRGECEPTTRMLLVAEAPTMADIREKTHLSGNVGQKFLYLLDRANIKEESLDLTYAVKCLTPKGKKPNKKAINACSPYLKYEILKRKPKVIVALGSIVAEQTIKGWSSLPIGEKQSRISYYRGFPVWSTFEVTVKDKTYSHSCWVMPTFSVGACLHSWELDDLFVYDLKNAVEYSRGNIAIKEPTTEFTVATCFDSAQRLIALIAERARSGGGLVLDLETTGLDPLQDRILCAGFCWEKGVAHVLPILGQHCEEFWTPDEKQKILEALGDALQDARLWGQNFKFDAKFLRRLLGLHKLNHDFDTMIAHHVLDENKPQRLTFLAQYYLGWDKYDQAMKPYVDEQGNPDYSLAPNEVCWKYLAFDVDATFQLRSLFIPRLKKEKVVTAFKIGLGLSQPLANIEYNGIHIDRREFQNLIQRYKKQAGDALKSLRGYAERWLARAEIDDLPKAQVKERAEDFLAESGFMDGFKEAFKGKSWTEVRRWVALQEGKRRAEKFNPISTKQFQALLIAVGATLNKKTKAGGISTDKTVLSALALKDNAAGRVARLVGDLRSSNKMLSTYLDGSSVDCKQSGIVFNAPSGGMYNLVTDRSYIHGNYSIARTRTGRLAGGLLMTLPRLGGLRRPFIPDDPEKDVLISADYNKAELRVMAWLAMDDTMLRELLNGVDLHSRMAITVKLGRDPTDAEFDRLLEKFLKLPDWKQQRAVAKGVNFGIPYGRMAPSIVDGNPDSFPLDMPKKQRIASVQAMIDAYFVKYHHIREYMQDQIYIAKKRGYLRSRVSGRKRRLSGADWFFSDYGQRTSTWGKDWSHIEREAQNFQIQEIASSELAKATVRVQKAIDDQKIPGMRILKTVHDQLLFNVRRGYEEEAKNLIVTYMSSVLPATKKSPCEMPIVVDADVQKWWGDNEYE